MPKQFVCLLAALVLLGVCATPALAAPDLTYSGPLDGRTDQPLEDTGLAGTTSPTATLYPLKEGVCSWSRKENAYLCYVGSQSFRSSVPPDAIVQQAVSISGLEGFTTALYKDGTELEPEDMTDISDPGSYVLDVTGRNAYDTMQFHFSILPDMVNNLIDYTAPSGFSFSTLTLDSQIISTDYTNYVSLDTEGTYQITYACQGISQQFSVKFLLDRTAPTMELPDVVNGASKGAVTLTITEEMLNDKNYLVITDEDGAVTRTAATTVLKVPGDYQVSLYDQAGNHTDYPVHIPVYLNISAVFAILIVVSGIGGIIFYSRWMRRHARVG